MSPARCYALAAGLMAAGGCSLVYDADHLRAGRDGGTSADADPEALFVAKVTPDVVFEGEGSSYQQEATVRAIPIVLEGQNMTAETVFTIEGLGLDGTIDDVTVSGDGHFAAFGLGVPILDDLADGEQGEALAIHLDKASETTDAPLIQIVGLDELEQTGGTLDTDELNAMYTHVVLSGEVSAVGSAPLRIVATAGISLGGTLRADAGTAPNAGPGGCRGGDPAAAADCGEGSGAPGESSASPGGGGGGGYGTEGTAGTGGAGQGGGTAGQKFVVPLPPVENATAHGAGGGGGGDNVATPGVRGGGSGGIIELTTPAAFTMTATVVLSSTGGDGANSTCTVGAGGGGGSGGAILLRAGLLLAAEGARATALGGAGRGDAGCRGGNGGKGRIRIDRGNDAVVEADPAVFIGATPMVEGLPVVATSAALVLGVRGEASKSYQVYLGDGGPLAFATEPDGTASPEVTLEPGLNRLCVQAASGANLDYPESTNCVNVAYIEP